MKLTTEDRKNLPDSSFALPGGRYPLPDISHGRNALARVSQHGTPSEKATVRRKVAQRFPGIKQSDPAAVLRSMQKFKK